VPKFQKKPVVIEAWLWDETKATFEELKAAGMTCGHYDSHLTEDFVRNMRIQTLEGSMFADKGDMIIKGVKGEFYPCKPDIFEATYSPVAEVPVSNILGFDREIGERSGSWKGGCIGCGWDMKPGETAEQTLRRMESERTFR